VLLAFSGFVEDDGRTQKPMPSFHPSFRIPRKTLQWPWTRVGERAAGKTVGLLQGLRATGGSPCEAAQPWVRRRPRDTDLDDAVRIEVRTLFLRSCRAANDETRPRPESILGERSFPALPLRATQIPSARAPQRTTRNGSSPRLRVSPLGSNRVTCDGSEDANALDPAKILTGIPVRKDDAIPTFETLSWAYSLRCWRSTRNTLSVVAVLSTEHQGSCKFAQSSHQHQIYATSLDDVRTQRPDPVPISTKVLVNRAIGKVKY